MLFLFNLAPADHSMLVSQHRVLATQGRRPLPVAALCEQRAGLDGRLKDTVEPYGANLSQCMV